MKGKERQLLKIPVEDIEELDISKSKLRKVEELEESLSTTQKDLDQFKEQYSNTFLYRASAPKVFTWKKESGDIINDISSSFSII